MCYCFIIQSVLFCTLFKNETMSSSSLCHWQRLPFVLPVHTCWGVMHSSSLPHLLHEASLADSQCMVSAALLPQSPFCKSHNRNVQIPCWLGLRISTGKIQAHPNERISCHMRITQRERRKAQRQSSCNAVLCDSVWVHETVSVITFDRLTGVIIVIVVCAG